jgi:PPM family protein phosphatase
MRDRSIGIVNPRQGEDVHFEIAGFTRKATGKAQNEDRILVYDRVLSEGEHWLPPLNACFAFVADGIGGSRSAATASQFVLDALRDRLPSIQWNDLNELTACLASVNEDLIVHAGSTIETSGSATTLVGTVLWPEGFHLINAGDSQAWMWREGRLFRVSEPQVLNPWEPGSPVTSYFGGRRNSLDLVIGGVLREVRGGDVLVFCSDGFLKALSADQVRAVLANNRPLADKVGFLARQVDAAHRPDDVSCVAVGALAKEALNSDSKVEVSPKDVVDAQSGPELPKS